MLAELPTFPTEIYDTLPGLLKKGTEAFKSAREKDVFLIGGLVVLSGFLDKTYGYYQGEKLHPNINAFVVAPASSGKSAFKYAKVYGMKMHRLLFEESRALVKEYYRQLRESKKNNGQEGKDLLAPPFKMGFLPGDITSAALMQRMVDNGGKGVICETEADSISNNLRKEHGGHDAIFRKAFHHETVSVARKAMNEVLEIERPRLSIGTTGTPEQVLPLVSSIENGLFSRFCFYLFSQASKWKRLSDKSQQSRKTEYFINMEEEAFTAIVFAEANPTLFSLSPEQEQQFDEQYEKWVDETVAVYGDDADMIVYRLGVITFRIAMILTTLRKAEEENKAEEVTCSDIDFKTAMALAGVFREHASFLYSRFTEGKVIPVQDRGAYKLYELLPPKFQRKEAIAIAEKHKISPSACGNYLKKLIDKKLLKYPDDEGGSAYGFYEKVKQETL
ncbi:hypothetical protein ABID22_000323 [Pontibacter aydingkolensis]